MEIGLYGGAFNPPHLGHLIVAETIRDQFGLDQILWVPTYQPPHKEPAGLVSLEDRLAMLRLAIGDHPAFAISDIERRLGGVSYTLLTIEALQEEAPDDRFWFILGGDSLRQFDSWHRPEEILKRVDLLVYDRPGGEGEIPAWIASHVQYADAPLIEISAQGIRARVAAGRSIRYLVPAPVEAYLQQHRLYRD